MSPFWSILYRLYFMYFFVCIVIYCNCCLSSKKNTLLNFMCNALLKYKINTQVHWIVKNNVCNEAISSNFIIFTSKIVYLDNFWYTNGLLSHLLNFKWLWRYQRRFNIRIKAWLLWMELLWVLFLSYLKRFLTQN